MAVIRAKVGTWCDYCSYRWHKNSINHNKAASWTVISEHPDRKGRMTSYCQACAQEVAWYSDGKLFGLEEQAQDGQLDRRLEFNV